MSCGKVHLKLSWEPVLNMAGWFAVGAAVLARVARICGRMLMMSNVEEISSEVINKTRCSLEAFASAKRTPTFSDIEVSLGVKFRRDQWRQVLDPIYEELRAAGEPDLTAIIVYGIGDKKGYPAYFSDGSKARSCPFNPNNLAQLSRWTEEVKRVFAKYRKP